MAEGIRAGGLTYADPAIDAAAVTPHDSNDLSVGDGAGRAGCRALYIGVTGNVKVDMVGGTAVTFANVPVGIFPVSVTRVYSTGTTASSIHALY